MCNLLLLLLLLLLYAVIADDASFVNNHKGISITYVQPAFVYNEDAPGS